MRVIYLLILSFLLFLGFHFKVPLYLVDPYSWHVHNGELSFNYFYQDYKKESALSHALKAVELDSSKSEAYELLARIYLKRGEYENLESILSILQKKDPYSFTLYSGLLYLERHNYLSALRMFEQARDYNATSLSPIIYSAFAYYHTGQAEKAANILEEHVFLITDLENNKNDFLSRLQMGEFYVGLSLSYKALGQQEEFERTHQKAKEYLPSWDGVTYIY